MYFEKPESRFQRKLLKIHLLFRKNISSFSVAARSSQNVNKQIEWKARGIL